MKLAMLSTDFHLVCVFVRVCDNRCRPDLYALTKYSLCCANTGDFHLGRHTQTHILSTFRSFSYFFFFFFFARKKTEDAFRPK